MIAAVLLVIAFMQSLGAAHDLAAALISWALFPTGLAMLAWGIFRAIKPVTVATVSQNSLSLRSRHYEKGWHDFWKWRVIPNDRIESVEIGRRTDFPRPNSYSDTASYEFLLARVCEAGCITRYSYAPLQRVARRDEFITALQTSLKDKVRLLETETS